MTERDKIERLKVAFEVLLDQLGRSGNGEHREVCIGAKNVLRFGRPFPTYMDVPDWP